MALNSTQPNSTADIDDVSKSVEFVLNNLQTPGSIQAVLNLATTKLGTTEGVQVRPMLAEMVNNVDRPLLKQMAQDVVTVMSNWFEDPQVLCCLIRGIYNFFSVSASDDVSLANSEFAKYMDVLIAFVDIIIVILSANVRKLNVAIPDFIAEIMNGVVGAIILVLQEVLFAIKDSIIKIIIEELNFRSSEVEDVWWGRCLPLSELMGVLKKYIGDYGLFASLFEKIKGHIANSIASWQFYKGLDFPQNVKDLEFLYWFRDLLVKLKAAAISFDLCFSAEYNPATSVVAAGGTPQTRADIGDVSSDDRNSPNFRSNPDQIQGISIAADGTILQDRQQLRDSTKGGGTIPVLTNSSIRGFLNKYYGYPLDVVDTLLVGATSADSVQGTDTGGNLDINADCQNSPTPAEAIQWALRVRNRNI